MTAEGFLTRNRCLSIALIALLMLGVVVPSYLAAQHVTTVNIRFPYAWFGLFGFDVTQKLTINTYVEYDNGVELRKFSSVSFNGKSKAEGEFANSYKEEKHKITYRDKMTQCIVSIWAYCESKVASGTYKQYEQELRKTLYAKDYD